MNVNISKLAGTVGRVIVGKKETVIKLIAALLCEGHVLLEDVPGVGKTQIISQIADECRIGLVSYTNARVFNTIIVGIAAKHMDFEKDEWLKVIEKTVPAKTIDINKAAFEAGYNL